MRTSLAISTVISLKLLVESLLVKSNIRGPRSGSFFPRRTPRNELSYDQNDVHFAKYTGEYCKGKGAQRSGFGFNVMGMLENRQRRQRRQRRKVGLTFLLDIIMSQLMMKEHPKYTMIKSIHAAQRLDSRGNPTVQVDLTTDRGTFRAIVPSGASTGANEAIELRDGDDSAYGGRGVQKAVSNVGLVIGPALVDSGLNVATDQKKIDNLLKELDGTKNKAKLGANAILGVSMACARAGAAHSDIPLYEFLRRESGAQKPFLMPVPFFNVLNGGVHSGNKMAFQETMIAPVGASSFTEAVQMGSEIYQKLKKVIIEKFGPSAIGIGDEGGFAPPISEPHEALDLLVQAVSLAGYTGKIKFAIDPASSEFYRDGNYDLGFKDKKQDVRSPKQLMDLYRSLLQNYPIVLLEDPFAESDWDSWTEFNKGCPVELVGDDLLVTNTQYVQEAYEKKACNSMLLKINQIGTISEAIEAANLAYSFDWSVFVSHRSGETTDNFIADLVVGLRTGHLKSGAPCRGERVAKYNRLMDIEADILGKGEKCIYAGSKFREAHKY